ncbi:MAG: DNA polymerase I, partial [Calditrichaeota bacterium]
MTKNKSIYLIDGSAMFYRAFFAFIRNPLINSKGEDTSATFGFVNSLLKIIDTEKPDYIAVAFDMKEETFRHKMYPEYKSTRAKMPEELVAQLPRIRQSVEALNIPSLEMEGYEADDIIGTIAFDAAQKGLDVWCVTGDKDFFQLVNEKIKIYNPKSATGEPILYDREGVKEKFGVYPELVIDKLALMGDSSDNVPGVPGIGPKTADTLLEQFGSLESVLENHDQIKAKGQRQKIADNIDQAKLSKELVTIDTKVPVKYKLDDLKKVDYNYEKSKELFMELEFGRILKQVLGESELPEEIDIKEKKRAKHYQTITSLDALKILVTSLSKCKEIAIDTETTSINSLDAELVGVSISEKSNAGYYIPVGHTTDKEKNLPLDKTLKILKPLLENKKVQKFGQNIKYDLQVFHRYDIDIKPIGFDTMLAGYILDPSARANSLTMLALKYFDYQMQPISDLIGSGKNQKSFDIVPVDKAAFYAVEDSDYTYQLRAVLAPKIEEHEMTNLYYNIELPLVKILSDMEETGINVNVKFLNKLSKSSEKKIEKLKKEIYEIAGDEFNINSTQQLSHILFEKLNLPTKGKTAKKTGYATDVKVLEELAQIHDFPKLILEYRQVTKLKSTYIDAIPKLVREDTKRVHTSFNQTIAATGRLSSTDPNLQNIPIRTEEGREIRKAFIPRDANHSLLVAD